MVQGVERLLQGKLAPWLIGGLGLRLRLPIHLGRLGIAHRSPQHVIKRAMYLQGFVAVHEVKVRPCEGIE